MINTLEVSEELAAARTELDDAILVRQRAEWAGAADDDHDKLRQRVIRAGSVLRDVEQRERQAAEAAALARRRAAAAPLLARAAADMETADAALVQAANVAVAALDTVRQAAAAREATRTRHASAYTAAGVPLEYPPSPPPVVLRWLVAGFFDDLPRVDVAALDRSAWCARVDR